MASARRLFAHSKGPADYLTRPELVPSSTVAPPPTVIPPITVIPPTIVTSQPSITAPKAQKGVTAFMAKTVQDGHTRAEQAIYQTLWNNGTPEEGSDNRRAQMGMSELARRAGGSQNQLRRNLRSLQAKLAIEPLSNSDPLTARSYRVLHYGQILERRRAAGLVWVLRARASVDLVTSLNTMAGPPTVSPPPTMVGGDTVIPPPPPTVGGGGPPTVVPPLNKELLNKELLNKSSSSAVVEATPDFDDDARRQLVTACHRVAPDVTGEEIAEFTERKRIYTTNSRKRIDNIVGFLLESVPKSLAAGLRRYREGKAESARQVEEDRRRREAHTAELIADCERILADPAAGEEAKASARSDLASLKGM